MLKVFDDASWHFSQRPFILKIWELGMNLSQEMHTSVPVWVKISNIPLEGWNEEGIATVGSALGRSIHSDFTIEDRSQMSFVRLCIEIDVSSTFLRYVNLYKGLNESSGEPKMLQMPIEYQWVPSVCTHCRVPWLDARSSLCQMF